MNKLEASLRDFEAALEIDTDHQMALNGRGSVLRQLGRASPQVASAGDPGLQAVGECAGAVMRG